VDITDGLDVSILTTCTVQIWQTVGKKKNNTAYSITPWLKVPTAYTEKLQYGEPMGANTRPNEQ
jgi:hypothetical protein